MANGDGFAVKTTIAQMGAVAKTQLKSQQAQPAGAEHARKPGEKESRVEKVREAEEAQKTNVDPDRRRDGKKGSGKGRDEDDPDRTEDDLHDDDIGLMVDIKA